MSDERSATAIDRRLGLAVRTRRLELGMSQERLADLLGVTFQQVQKYEKGVNRIAASRLVSVGAALGMSGAALLAKVENTKIVDADVSFEGELVHQRRRMEAPHG